MIRVEGEFGGRSQALSASRCKAGVGEGEERTPGVTYVVNKGSASPPAVLGSLVLVFCLPSVRRGWKWHGPWAPTVNPQALQQAPRQRAGREYSDCCSVGPFPSASFSFCQAAKALLRMWLDQVWWVLVLLATETPTEPGTLLAT